MNLSDPAINLVTCSVAANVEHVNLSSNHSVVGIACNIWLSKENFLAFKGTHVSATVNINCKYIKEKLSSQEIPTTSRKRDASDDGIDSYDHFQQTTRKKSKIGYDDAGKNQLIFGQLLSFEEKTWNRQNILTVIPEDDLTEKNFRELFMNRKVFCYVEESTLCFAELKGFQLSSDDTLYVELIRLPQGKENPEEIVCSMENVVYIFNDEDLTFELPNNIFDEFDKRRSLELEEYLVQVEKFLCSKNILNKFIAYSCLSNKAAKLVLRNCDVGKISKSTRLTFEKERLIACNQRLYIITLFPYRDDNTVEYLCGIVISEDILHTQEGNRKYVTVFFPAKYICDSDVEDGDSGEYVIFTDDIIYAFILTPTMEEIPVDTLFDKSLMYDIEENKQTAVERFNQYYDKFGIYFDPLTPEEFKSFFLKKFKEHKLLFLHCPPKVANEPIIKGVWEYGTMRREQGVQGKSVIPFEFREDAMIEHPPIKFEGSFGAQSKKITPDVAFVDLNEETIQKNIHLKEFLCGKGYFTYE